MKRRDLIIGSLKAVALMTIGKPLGALSESTGLFDYNKIFGPGNALRFPPLFTNGGVMNLGNYVVEVWPSQNTNVIAINGSYPCPTVKIQKGQTFTAIFQNNLSEPATCHWHGLSVPELMDGHPKDPVLPGSSYTYTFTVLNRAGTYFYHSHAHMLTAKQVYKGFAGFFIVTDPDENIFNLPSGNFDIPLCIQDRRIADIPQFTYLPTSYEMMWGYLGDTVLVNGTPDAYLSVSRTLYRFRLLNGSNARVYRIAFSDNRQFHIIATDGGLKDQPVAVNEFKLSPGERVDILFDFSPYNIGQNVKLVSLPYSHSGTLPYKQGIPLDIIRFDVVNNNSSGGVVPSSFNPITYYDINSVNNVRNFTLSVSGSGHPMHRINGLSFDINRIDWEVPLNSLEEWKIINTTADFHPMHSHELQFQVYSRNGNTNLPPSDKGWKDTVLVNPGETVRTLVKFTGYKGIYLYHCHNLEHEDDGMMLNFRIIDPIGIKKTSSEITDEFSLSQNYPNPFNSTTVIKFRLPAKDNIVLNVFDLKGKIVARLFEGELNAGEYQISWDAKDFSSGTYIAKLKMGAKSKSVKMIIAK